MKAKICPLFFSSHLLALSSRDYTYAPTSGPSSSSLNRVQTSAEMQSYELHARENTEPRRAPVQRDQPKRWILNAFECVSFWSSVQLLRTELISAFLIYSMSTAGHQSPGLWKHLDDK